MRYLIRELGPLSDADRESNKDDELHDGDAVAWRERTRLVLTPTAAPSILGGFALAGAAFLVAAVWIGWYGSSAASLLVLGLMVVIFGGLAQMFATAVAYRARDGVATAVHGVWAAFFLALGTVWILAGTGAVAIGVVTAAEVGLWLGIVAVITLVAAAASAPSNFAMAGSLCVLGIAAGLACAGFVGGVSGLVTAAGWTLLGAVVLTTYAAAALMIDEAMRREVLPTHTTMLAARPPRAQTSDGGGGRATYGLRTFAVPDVIEYPAGMPGAHAGQ